MAATVYINSGGSSGGDATLHTARDYICCSRDGAIITIKALGLVYIYIHECVRLSRGLSCNKILFTTARPRFAAVRIAGEEKKTTRTIYKYPRAAAAAISVHVSILPVQLSWLGTFQGVRLMIPAALITAVSKIYSGGRSLITKIMREVVYARTHVRCFKMINRRCILYRRRHSIGSERFSQNKPNGRSANR